MLKVKLKHSSAEVNKVYTILTDNHVPIIRSDYWDDTVTCLVEDEAVLMFILNALNRGTLLGVRLLSSRPTLSTILRSLIK